MKSNHNQARSYQVPPKAVALVSALAIAVGGAGASTAGANTGGIEAPATSANTGGIGVPEVGANVGKPKSETPLRALTGVIAKLEKGKQAEVTARDVKIPDLIGAAEGQPIVFKEDGRTYFAYTQEHQPDFHLTPEETASTMAIVKGHVVPTIGAHLDKIGELVDTNEHTVGYSIGGDSGGK